MATDDLDAPLAPRAPKKRRLRLPIRIPHLIALLLLLCVGVFVGWAVLVDDPFGGEPMVIVAANSRSSAPPKKAETPPAPEAAKPNPNPSASPMPVDTPAETPGDGKTVTIIDGLTGKRQEVKVNPSEPRGSGNALAPTSIDQKTLEMSRHGTIPKIGPDGARPSEIYAHPVKPDAKPNAPRVAIIVSGLGIGANTTSEALAKLPGPVTFAFAPYGTDLPRWVARARGEGHDVLLQVPMEPFDYPDSDPGPQTLLVGLDTNQNLDRLHWFMSRFQGYVGLINYMGARFTATEAAITPIVREAARRGLIYFDDGSSPRSQASQIAGANNVAFAKADVVIDTVPSQADIDRALARLEQLARQRGSAVGIAGALPITIDRISQWMKAAEQRGILLVPISALANKPKSSS